MRNKFNARLTTVDGIVFQSMAEAKRFSELKLLEKAGKISALKPHPKFPIEFHGRKICTVIGDAEYIENDQWVVEDIKSVATNTAVSKLKRKLVAAQYQTVEWRLIWV